MIKSGKLYCYVGKSRSGKTQRAMKLIESHKLVLIWDIQEQYKASYRCRTIAQLKSIFSQQWKRNPDRREVIAFTGAISDFNDFCESAYLWIKGYGARGKHTCVVFEETADVTSPGKAPEHYGRILRQTLKYGVDLVCITQRPAESDKTSIGNASIIHVCSMSTRRDRVSIAGDTDIPLAEISELRADQDQSRFDFIELDKNKATYRKGALIFKGNRPSFIWVDSEKPVPTH